MANKKTKVIRKACRRTATSKIIYVRSSLARKMLQMVVQLDLAYDQLKVTLEGILAASRNRKGWNS